MALEQEIETFRTELPYLLQQEGNRGQYVLIHGIKVDSIWPTREAALAAGYDKFGLDPFLVQEITEHEKPRYFSRNVKRCP